LQVEEQRVAVLLIRRLALSVNPGLYFDRLRVANEPFVGWRLETGGSSHRAAPPAL